MEFELRRIRDEVMILMFAYHRRNKKNAQVQRSDQNYIIHCKKGEQMFIYTVYIYIYTWISYIHTQKGMATIMNGCADKIGIKFQVECQTLYIRNAVIQNLA